ncbi:MAG: DUF2510 domain-containing protein [Acidimicrobiia bacterium]
MGSPNTGWHDDPYNRHELRYFDGSRWTDDISDNGRQGTDPTSGAVVAPPRPQVARPIYRPVQQTPPTIIVKTKSKWPWVLLGIFVFMVVGFVGCAALLVGGANEAIKSINAEQEKHAISQAQYDAIPIGTSKALVVAGLAKEPTDTSSFKSQVSGDVTIQSDCIYYWESGKTFGNFYTFCFDANGNLETKSQA